MLTTEGGDTIVHGGLTDTSNVLDKSAKRVYGERPRLLDNKKKEESHNIVYESIASANER